MSRESVRDGNCIKPRKLWEFDSSSLNFKIISIHYNPSCCHLASRHSAAVRKQWEWFQGVNGLNLVLFLPSSLFPFSPMCETFAVVRRYVHLSVQQMQSNCATVQVMSSCRRTWTGFPNRTFPATVPSVTSALSVWETLRPSAGHAAACDRGCFHLLVPTSSPGVGTERSAFMHVAMIGVCVGLAVPGPGVFGDSGELRHV